MLNTFFSLQVSASDATFFQNNIGTIIVSLVLLASFLYLFLQIRSMLLSNIKDLEEEQYKKAQSLINIHNIDPESHGTRMKAISQDLKEIEMYLERINNKMNQFSYQLDKLTEDVIKLEENKLHYFEVQSKISSISDYLNKMSKDFDFLKTLVFNSNKNKDRD